MPPLVIFFYKFIFCIPYLTSNVICQVYTEVANRKFGILRSQSRWSPSQSLGGGGITGVVFVDSGKLFPLLRNAIPYHIVYSFPISRWYGLAGIRHTYLQSASNISYLVRYNTLRQHSHVPLSSQISNAVQGKFWSAVLIKTVRIYIFQT